MFTPRQLYILFMVCCLFPLQAFTYPVDSLMAAIGQVPVEDQHKKVMNELTRLRDSKPVDGVELGNYWINILNEKQLRPEAAATILLTATCYYRIGNYAQCLQYTQTARNLFKLNGNPDGEAQSLRDLGFCYAHMDAYEDAYESYQKSIAIFDRLGNNNELAGCYNHLGNLIEEWKKDYTTAQKLYETSMAYAVKANNQESISYSLEFIGIIKSELGDNDSAIVYFDRSLTIRKELNLPVPLAISYTNIAEVMHKKGDLNGAEHYFREALTISRNLQYNDLTTFLYENLSKVHKKKGNLDSAITYMELQQAMKDSLFNLQKTQEFAEIKEKYESELKEEKIRNLNKQIEIKNQKYRNRIYFFTVVVVSMGALVLLALLILVYFYYKEQRKVALEKILSLLIPMLPTMPSPDSFFDIRSVGIWVK